MEEWVECWLECLEYIINMTSNLPRVKILILGEGGVGKTSLLSQFIDQEFKPTHMPTIGVEYKQKIIDYLSETPVRVQSTP